MSYLQTQSRFFFKIFLNFYEQKNRNPCMNIAKMHQKKNKKCYYSNPDMNHILCIVGSLHWGYPFTVSQNAPCPTFRPRPGSWETLPHLHTHTKKSWNLCNFCLHLDIVILKSILHILRQLCVRSVHVKVKCLAKTMSNLTFGVKLLKKLKYIMIAMSFFNRLH